MSDQSKIEWTDATWNPVRGCSRVSEGCRNCYAERQAVRFAKVGQPFRGFAQVTAPRDDLDRVGGRRNGWTGRVELIPEKLDEPLRWKKPRRIFVNSMSDLFHEKLNNEVIAAVFGVMAACPQHTFQILTKRPERMRQWFDWVASKCLGANPNAARWCAKIAHNKRPDVSVERALVEVWDGRSVPPWPLPNVWLGVSVEDQATADERIPLLLQTPAVVWFCSYEPALGPVDFKPWLGGDCERCQSCGDHYREVWCTDDASWLKVVGRGGGLRCPDCFRFEATERRVSAEVAILGEVPALDWLIVGGESGPGARPLHFAWARSARDQCKAAGVPFFFKQAGSKPFSAEDRISHRGYDGRFGPLPQGFSRYLNDRKGGDMSEWPEGLRVREFPAVRAAWEGR